MGLDSVLVIADQVDDNLFLASRNLANVLVVEPRYADPLSLVFKKVLVTKAAVEQAQGDAGMSTTQKFDEGRLAQVLLAPIVPKGHAMVAEKHNQVLFRCPDATKPEIKAAVELLFKVEVSPSAW